MVSGQNAWQLPPLETTRPSVSSSSVPTVSQSTNIQDPLAYLSIGGFSAWVCIENKAAQVYGVERIRHSGIEFDNETSCWIASEVGKKFSINWRNEQRDFPIQAVVLLDGKPVDKHIMLDARRFPNKPNGVGVSFSRTSDFTRRDFQFSNILISDDDAYLDTINTTMGIGVITLELWRMHVSNVTSQELQHRYGENSVLEHQIVHERSKKAGAHHVTFGNEYSAAAPVMDIVQGYLEDSEPLLTFTFKYRPYDLLLANGVIPRDPTTSGFVSHDTISEIKKLEERLETLRKQALQGRDGAIQAESSSSSSSNSKNASLARRRKARELAARARQYPEVIDLTHLDDD